MSTRDCLPDLSRREILQAAGAVALAPMSRWSTGEWNDETVGWAVLGLGGYAQGEILPAFARTDRAKLVSFVSGSPDKAARLGKQYGIASKDIYTYESMGRLKDDPRIQVIYVITPPGTHRRFVEAAAATGKHVFCEKPMAPTAEDCRAMIAACRKAGKKLGIGYRSRYEAHNVAAIAAIRRQELGKIQSLSSDHGFNIGRGLWRTQKALAGGGSMMDIGIYSLNALRYLSGEEPVEVSATITNPPNDDRFKEVEDTVHFTFRFPSGLVGVGTSGYSWNPGANRYKVEGEKAILHAEPATPYEGHRFLIDGKPLPTAPGKDQFAAMLDAFSAHVAHGTPFLAPGEEGLRDIRIIQAIYESAAKGKPVSLK